MSFRTVMITKQSRLSYKNHFMVVKQDLDEKYIHLSEIDTIIVDSISVSISSYLLKELSDYKINIIFCDVKHNPYGELNSLYGRHNSSKQITKQIKWTLKDKDLLWQEIVKNKISNQAIILRKIKSEQYSLLLQYVSDVKTADKTNREGHAAKVYFNALFGKKFVRNHDDDINAALNYGYAILLSSFNKEIVNNGYITQLGIHHKNEFNPYNLACDLMEPFRMIIDYYVYENQKKEFNSEFKMGLIDLFNCSFLYNQKSYTLKDVIKLYTKNALETLEGKKYKSFLYEER